MYENKLEFPEGRGVQNKNLPWGEYGYFLELHNIGGKQSQLLLYWDILHTVEDKGDKMPLFFFYNWG